MSWIQPSCNRCWREANPDRFPQRIVASKMEMCSNCGVTTRSGIYVRADPASVYFPHVEN